MDSSGWADGAMCGGGVRLIPAKDCTAQSALVLGGKEWGTTRTGDVGIGVGVESKFAQILGDGALGAVQHGCNRVELVALVAKHKHGPFFGGGHQDGLFAHLSGSHAAGE